ncbi:MAG TPA: alpha/beta hydrolase [Solirubrobacteraceae bacterium]|nr:alpha/beta hydrolase [Solirubrobacteraceae bacterium]
MRAYAPRVAPGPLGDVVAIQTLALPSGRRLRYVDIGPRAASTVVFFGGMATSAGAAGLTELACTRRHELGLRLLSVERNGLGQTPLRPADGYGAGAREVLAMLDALGVRRCAVVAVSGGAPFAAALAAVAPARIASLHLSAAAAGPLPERGEAAVLLTDTDALTVDPARMWAFPADSPVHAIPGFAEAARAEGRRALARGAEGLRHEWSLLAGWAGPDLRGLRAPVHLYSGAEDRIVGPEHAARWARAAGHLAAHRHYPGVGHEVTYLHWDTIMDDVAAAATASGERA